MTASTSPPSLSLSLLTLPTELRHQIYVAAFADLHVWPLAPSYTPDWNCTRCCRHHHRLPHSGHQEQQQESGDGSNNSNSNSNNGGEGNGEDEIILFETAFRPLLTCKQIYTEAYPVFCHGLTVHINDDGFLRNVIDYRYRYHGHGGGAGVSDQRRRETLLRRRVVGGRGGKEGESSSSSPLSLSSQPKTIHDRIERLTLTIHLNDDTRQMWHARLTTLLLSFPLQHQQQQQHVFPALQHLTIHNHMRPPTSYDRLIDAIYLASPIVTAFPPHLRHPPGLVLKFEYLRDEIMFESPFLGEITTGDSLDAHEAVIRDLLADELFAVAARGGSGSGGGEASAEAAEAEANHADDSDYDDDDGDISPRTSTHPSLPRVTVPAVPNFEAMTGRLLFVARSHEEEWLEGLQRRRLGGLTVREVQERVLRQEARERQQEEEESVEQEREREQEGEEQGDVGDENEE